jgi:DNA-binding response OmpR family regulator
MAINILVAIGDDRLRAHLDEQLAADGHAPSQAGTPEHVRVLLAGRDVDVLLLGALESQTAALELLRALRAGELDQRIPQDLPVITLGGRGDIDTLRAYEAGSDHHLPANAPYLIQRAVIAAVHRRAHPDPTVRPIHRVGALEIDATSRQVRIDGEPVHLTGKEFALLRTLASEPRRVFTKEELAERIWGSEHVANGRRVNQAAHRARQKLHERGQQMVRNTHGVGWSLTD